MPGGLQWPSPGTRMNTPARTVRAAICLIGVQLVVAGIGCRGKPFRADPAALAAASPELLDRLRADPYNYFRFINHEWTERVCDAFAGDLPTQPIVQLHGDAHIEQYALTKDAWGLDDFDDATRGPALVDITRFLGSIDLSVRRRGWVSDREQLFDRFFDGYRRGLSDASYRAPRPDIVRWIADQHPPPTREAFLVWAETKMMDMPEASMKGLIASMAAFAKLLQHEQPDLHDGYFRVLRAGWLRMGIGSAANRKILVRVRGPSDDPADDELLEVKALRGLKGINCLKMAESRPAFRIILGSQQLGRLKHKILVAGPEDEIPGMTVPGENLSNWWIRSWEPSYREIQLDDLRSAQDLSALVYDSGVQLGAGSIHATTAPDAATFRAESLTAIATLELRLRNETKNLVEEMLRGWRDLGTR